MFRRSILLTCLRLAVAFTLVAWSRPARARPDPTRIDELKENVAKVLKREGVPGVGLAIVDAEGIVWAGGVGVADLEEQTPVTEHTLFRMASITKSFIALGVGRLSDQGRLDLDAPLREIIPEVEIGNRWAAQSPITLAHVLEHTAGFDDMRFNETFGPKSVERQPLLDALAANPRSRVARWRPGTRHSYSNPGYTVAAAAIEAAIGARYQDYLRAEVLAPMGIRDARFHYDAAAHKRLAQGYVAPGLATPYHAIHHHPAGAMITSTRELAKLVYYFVSRSDAVVAGPTLARIERADTLPYPPNDVTYGLGNYGDVLHPTVCRGHNGGLPGFSTDYRYCPALQAGYVMLLNSSHSARAHVAIRRLLFDFIAHKRNITPPPPEERPRAELEAYVGHYEFLSPRHELFGFVEKLGRGVTVKLESDDLFLELMDGRCVPLISTGPASFRLPGQGGSSVTFTRGRDGSGAMVLYGAYFERGSGWLARARLRVLGWGRWILWTGVWAFAVNLVAWRLRRWIGPIVGAESVFLLAFPALSAACLYGSLLAFASAGWLGLGTRNTTTVAICVLTIAFAVVAVLAVLIAIRSLVTQRLTGGITAASVRLHALLGGLACAGMALWLGVNGIIGLRTWAW